MLINYTGIPCEKWSDEKKREATWYGGTVDYKVAPIYPVAQTDDIHKVAERDAKRIVTELRKSRDAEDAVLIGGVDPVLAVAMVGELRNSGVTCLSTVSKIEYIEDGQGNAHKFVRFVKFREY